MLCLFCYAWRGAALAQTVKVECAGLLHGLSGEVRHEASLLEVSLRVDVNRNRGSEVEGRFLVLGPDPASTASLMRKHATQTFHLISQTQIYIIAGESGCSERWPQSLAGEHVVQ